MTLTANALTTPAFAGLIGLMAAHVWFIHRDGTIPGWLEGATWIAVFIAPIPAITTSEDAGIVAAFVFHSAFVLFLLYRLSSRPAPGPPDAYAGPE